MADKTDLTTVEKALADLAAHADFGRPRLFAIYGILHSDQAAWFCGWGMEWDSGEHAAASEGEGTSSAIFYDPDDRTIWRSASAENVLGNFQRIGTVRLTWFDECD